MMSNSIILMDNRQLIPRWHTSRKAMSLQFPSLTNIKRVNPFEKDHFLESVRQNWISNKNILTATELYTALLVRDIHNDPDGLSALNFLVQNENCLKRGVRDLVTPRPNHIDKSAKYYSYDRKDVASIISRLKSIVRNFPEDFMTWCDLAFYYTVLGHEDKAEVCISVAWKICNGNSYVARSYARFLIHRDDPEQAMWILKKSGYVGKEPMITSASIAIANTFDLRGPEFTRANKLLNDHRGIPAFSSELAAALGTIEVLNGRKKKARELFRIAFRQPSENTISQFKWLKHKYDFEIHGLLQDDGSTLEGSVNELYVQGQFKECRDKLLELFDFQPISGAPIADAGYMSLVGLNDPDFVIALSDGRVPYAHMSFGELNNLIVAKLMKSNIDNIAVLFRILSRKIENKSSETYGVYKATAGMLLFKLGQIEEAKELYQDAIKFFEQKGKPRSVALAQHYLSICMRDIDPAFYKSLRQLVDKKAVTLKMPELKLESKNNV